MIELLFGVDRILTGRLASRLCWLEACPRNRKIGKFWGRKTIAELPIVDPGTFL